MSSACCSDVAVDVDGPEPEPVGALDVVAVVDIVGEEHLLGIPALSVLSSQRVIHSLMSHLQHFGKNSLMAIALGKYSELVIGSIVQGAVKIQHLSYSHL